MIFMNIRDKFFLFSISVICYSFLAECENKIFAQTENKCPVAFGSLYCSKLLPNEDAQGKNINRVKVAWLGTAGLYVTDGKNSLLIDPFVSRPSLAKIILRQQIFVQEEIVKKAIDKLNIHNVDAVLVSHSHYDHSMDAPLFASMFNAKLFGSESTLNISRASALKNVQNIQIETDKVYIFGDFKIVFRESEHGKIILGKIPYPGQIDNSFVIPAPAHEYKLGKVYSILISHPSGTLLHHASAGWLPGTLKNWKAKVVFLGLAGRSSSNAVLENIVDAVGAQTVVPMHFDNFFKPLSSDAELIWGIGLEEFLKTAQSHNLKLGVKTLPLLQTVKLFD